MLYFEIDTKLPSLNEYTRACRTNARTGNEFKKNTEETIGWFILMAKNQKHLQAVQFPVEILIEWHEATKRRDVDNIQSAQKFILDAMTGYGILKDDSRKYVKQIHHVVYDDKKDYVRVTLIPAQSEEKIKNNRSRLKQEGNT